MNKNRKINTPLKKATILLTIILLSVSISFLTNNSNFEGRTENIMEECDKNIEDFDQLESITNLKSSLLGDDLWWNSSWRCRMIINVTNPYPYDFENYGVSATFDYTSLGQNIQSDLDDIRIVENDTLCKYYVKKDYPEVGMATVWFDTNINDTIVGDDIETDTYMYFGNEDAVNAEAIDPTDSFGWIKNGDFELDNNYSNYFDPYGWTFSHDPIDTIHGVSNPGVTDENSYGVEFCNLLLDTDSASQAERVYQGNNAYKFGANRDVLGFSDVYNSYAGAFFSYPFTIPIVHGAGIDLHLYRNPRTWGFVTNTPIDDDGYYIRLCDNYGPDPDSHTDIGTPGTYENYVEIWGGRAFFTGGGTKTGQWQHATKVRDWAKSVTMDTYSESSVDGDLTAPLNFTISKFEGDTIFLEFGVWGTEDNYRSGFFQLDDVRFNYTDFSTSFNELQYINSSVTVITRDLDGRIVPNAEVMLVDSALKGLPGYQLAYGVSDSNGRVTFRDLENRKYNITANYTQGSREVEVFNSFDLGTGPYNFNGIFYIEEITLDLWTIDFEVVDWDGIPLSSGYIKVNNESGGDLLQTLTLNENGKTTFRWLNTSYYYFSVYYDNDDYYGNPLLLNESYIYRSNYDRIGDKYQEQSIWVNNTNTAPPGTSYSVSQYIYTNGSKTELGNKKLTEVKISLTNMVDQLEDVSVYYIDKDDSTGTSSHLIYFEDGYSPGEDNDVIELDIPLIENTKLESENYKVYGLLIEVNGINYTNPCDGIIKVETVETCNIYNRTHLARMNIKTVDTFGNPISSKIKITDIANNSQSLVNLSASSTTTGGYAYDNSDYPFWYLKDRTYNFTIDAYNITNAVFDVSYVDPPNGMPSGVTWYNFTLTQYSTINFTVYLPGVNISYYLTSFSNISGTVDAYWGEDISFSVIFEYTDDNGINWYPVIDPRARCRLFISEVGVDIDLITEIMEHGTGAGNFTITLDSSSLSAGGSGKIYNVRIEASYPGYPDPAPSPPWLLTIKSIPTTISVHDHDTQIELPDKLYTAYYDDLISIMVQYSVEFGAPLSNALLSYSWLGLPYVKFTADPVYTDYYTFTINTSKAQTTGLKVISITAYLENFTALTITNPFSIYLDIKERKTSLNDITEDIYYLRPPDIWVENTEIFMFTYRDYNTGKILGDLSTASFVWEELYENGTKKEGVYGSGELMELSNKTYELDFNTELRPVGNYFLFITMKKENYEEKTVFINLRIVLRKFTETVLVNSRLISPGAQISVYKGTSINFNISLTDDSRNNIDLQGATVEIYFGNTGINISAPETLGTPGLYTLSFSTSYIDTFITPKTFVVIIYINAANFTSVEIPMVITVNMDEIFPGMPTFYFILIIVSIAGVVGSIVAYRVIQQARIPKHVKKIRKIKSLIKSKKKITEIPSIPTKEQMIAKLFGDDWKEIGLSLDDVLGIQDLKSKKLPIKDKISKEGGED
ncbi:MAG: carboxypeptidase regulatory-like domain-containing protein [Promethearchaeota archaeon]|nr:MAG: carboxypeptidase regulatory-like domain-containing protein [Candidatus Lokiarchaeota archaeon]